VLCGNENNDHRHCYRAHLALRTCLHLSLLLPSEQTRSGLASQAIIIEKSVIPWIVARGINELKRDADGISNSKNHEWRNGEELAVGIAFGDSERHQSTYNMNASFLFSARIYLRRAHYVAASAWL